MNDMYNIFSRLCNLEDSLSNHRIRYVGIFEDFSLNLTFFEA